MACPSSTTRAERVREQAVGHYRKQVSPLICAHGFALFIEASEFEPAIRSAAISSGADRFSGTNFVCIIRNRGGLGHMNLRFGVQISDDSSTPLAPAACRFSPRTGSVALPVQNTCGWSYA